MNNGYRNFLIILFGLSGLFYGCQNTNDKENLSTVQDNVVEDFKQTKQNDAASSIRSQPAGYIILKVGTDAFVQADSTSEVAGHIDYGTRVEILSERDGWLNVQCDGLDSSAYIRKRSTGKGSNIRLFTAELYMHKELDSEECKACRISGDTLNKYLKLSLVSEEEFVNRKKEAAHYFLTDTLTAHKQNDIIRLKTAKGIVKLKDVPTDSEERTEVYKYLGQYPDLNKYLVGVAYYEDYDYNFFDKTTGEKLTLASFPELSFDKQYIASLCYNVYTSTADFYLYRVSNGQIRSILNTSFVKWMPEEIDWGKNDMFWGRDNCLYIKAYHSNVFKEGLTYTQDQKNFQYIKMEVLKKK